MPVSMAIISEGFLCRTISPNWAFPASRSFAFTRVLNDRFEGGDPSGAIINKFAHNRP